MVFLYVIYLNFFIDCDIENDKLNVFQYARYSFNEGIIVKSKGELSYDLAYS